MKPGIVTLFAAMGLMPALYTEPPVVAILEYPQCAKDFVLAVRPLSPAPKTAGFL